MKYLQEFHNSSAVKSALAQLAAEANPSRKYRFMEFCGGHTHALFRHGLPQILPSNVKMVHGPGCPVCVLPAHKIDSAISVLENAQDTENITLCTYADLMRVPGIKRDSFTLARARGLNIIPVYSPIEALQFAEKNPERKVIFFAIGFETTAPATAAALKRAKANNTLNFFVFCNHVLTPPAVQFIADAPDLALDGFLGPGHVSMVIGSNSFAHFAQKYNKPIVITGFTPLDIIHALLLLVRQVNCGESKVDNQYSRAVTKAGNLSAKSAMEEVFTLRQSFDWRGLGAIPDSAYKLKENYNNFDAEKHFNFPTGKHIDNRGCLCGSVLRGTCQPQDCKLFAKICTPENPMGPCMVSSEGACAAHYHYGSQDHAAE